MASPVRQAGKRCLQPGTPSTATKRQHEMPPRENLLVKEVRCNVHGTIKLEKLLVDVMDTAVFQRLKRLRQLGTSDHVYPTATHSRFEHSLGVAHLAGNLCRSLQSKPMPPGVEPPSECDVLCVKLAGLCHDLGHGPFSHAFSEIVPWFKHEKMSAKLLDLLFVGSQRCLSLSDYSAGGKVLDDKDLTFVKELIDGVEPKERVGRERPKWYLYDIVSNKAMDVDRCDYLLRDPVRYGGGWGGAWDGRWSEAWARAACSRCPLAAPLLQALGTRLVPLVPQPTHASLTLLTFLRARSRSIAAVRTGPGRRLLVRSHLRECRRSAGSL